jgi:hypothetical protein
MSVRLMVMHPRSKERGQTIILVAVAMVGLLGMAALAIDVTTLYVAKGELQRAADAAALAGAKAFVDSGVTTDPTNVNRQSLAQTMATNIIASLMAQNNVSGAPPVPTTSFDFSHLGNPQVTVTLQRNNLPTFFARIWGTQTATASATSVAEAFNPANSQNNTGNYVPIAPKCVKPLLVANQDPQTTLRFVDPVSGAPVAAGVVGEQINLYPACTATGGLGACTTITPNPPAANNPTAKNLNYIVAQVTPNAKNLCPSCEGATDFEQSIECCDFNAYSCGAAAVKIFTDTSTRHGQFRTETTNGVQCLIGVTPDTLDPTSLVGFTAGTESVKIRSNSGAQSGNFVTTSNSIANLPIIDTAAAIPTAPGTSQVTVIGFLQVFIDGSTTVTSPPAGFHTEIQAHVLNVVGCGNNPAATPPVLGGGFSPIPVRLIH